MAGDSHRWSGSVWVGGSEWGRVVEVVVLQLGSRMNHEQLKLSPHAGSPDLMRCIALALLHYCNVAGSRLLPAS